jgi:hypothetical protein
MNENQPGPLDSLIQEKLSADTAFQESLAGLNEEEIAAATAAKETELRNAEFAAAREYGENQKKRAEKAEGKVKPKDGEYQPPKVEKISNEDDDQIKLSFKDSYALQNAKVHIDDVDDVVKAAKLLGTDVPGALSDPVLQGILQRKNEERASADAAATTPSRPGSHKVTGAELLKNLSEGKVPEPGSEEAEDLFWARRGGRRS